MKQALFNTSNIKNKYKYNTMKRSDYEHLIEVMTNNTLVYLVIVVIFKKLSHSHYIT